MGSTTSRGYPYPFAADTNNVPADLLALANAINTDVGTVAAAKLDAATVGNLLTVNQASVETDGTGLYGYQHCSVARTTAVALDGSASLAVTTGATVSTFFTPSTGNSAGSGVSVTAGQTYTGSAFVRSAVTPRTAQAAIYWWTAGGSFISASYGNTVTTTTTGWTRTLSAAVAPATAAKATVHVIFSCDGTVGEVHYVDCWGLWQGAGGTWALPGTPIANLGFYTDETVGRRLFQWDANNARFQQTFGDTGLRDVTAALGNNAHYTINNADLRRIGATVEFYCDFTTTAAWVAGDNLFAVPSGFQPQVSRYGIVTFYNASSAASLYSGGNIPLYGLAVSTTYRARAVWNVTQAWPTTLPGVAIGSIPQ